VGVFDLTKKFAENKAQAELTIASLDKMALSLKGIQTGLTDTGEFPEGGPEPGKRTPSNAPPASKQLMAAVEAAGVALAKLQAQLAAIGTGPEMNGVLKIEEEFAKNNIEIDNLCLGLEKAGGSGIPAFRAQMQGLATDIEKAKLDAFADTLSTKMEVAVADLGAKFQMAGSQAAIFAETVKGMADLDKIAQTLKDDAIAMLEWGLAIGKTIQDQGDRVEWLTAVWNNFEATRAQQRQEGADAEARFQAQQKLKDQAAFANKTQDWTLYLNTVFLQNLAAEQNVTQAWQNALDTTSAKMVASADTLEQGLAAGLMKFQRSLGTLGQNVATAIENIGASLQSTLSTGFFDVITGKISDLGQTFKKFGEDILKSISDVFSKILMRWLMVAAGVAENPLQAGTTVGGGGAFGLSGSAPAAEANYVGGANYLGGAGMTSGGGWSALAGAGGMMGIGMGINTLGHAQTTGQYVGGAMEVIGGTELAAIAASGMGGALGAAAGAIVVPVYGWIAAITIIIVGAIIAAFSKPPDIKIPVHVGEELAANMNSALSSAILQSYGNTLGGLAQITTAGGGDVAKVLGSLRGGEIPDEYLKSIQMTIYGKNEDDLQKGLKNFLQTALPQTLMSFAFGRTQTGTTDKGANEDQLYGVPKFGGIDFTKPTAIVQMLQGLGFVNDKINEIASQIDVKAPDEFVKWLTAYVEAVKGLQDASKKIGRSYEEIVADLDKASKQTPAETFAPAIADLTNQIAVVGNLTSDEQISKAHDLVSSIQQLIAQEEQAVAELHAMATQIQDQAKSLHDAVDQALRTPAEQLAFVISDMATQFTALQDAANPADVQEAWTAFLSDATVVINNLVARIQAIETLQQSATNFLTSMGQPIIDPSTNLFAYLVQNQATIEAVTTAFQNATGDQQVVYAQQLFGLIQDRYNFEVQQILKIQGMIESINQSIDEQISGIQMQGMTPQQKAETLWGKIHEAQARIPFATSPEEVNRLVGEIQGWVRQLQGLPVLPGHEQDAADLFVSTLRDTGIAATRALEHMGTVFQEDVDSLGEQMQTFVTDLGTALETAQTSLTTNLGLLDAATVIATGKLTDFGNALTAKIIPLQTALQAIIDALTGAALEIQKSTPDVPRPTTDPGEGNYWAWDPTTGTWVPKKNPTAPNKPPPTGEARARSPGTNGNGAGTNGNGHKSASSSSTSISIAVNVKTGSPDDIAAAVGANIVGPIVAWVKSLTIQAQMDLLTQVRAHPNLITPNAGGGMS
jgi:hypothetical protein